MEIIHTDLVKETGKKELENIKQYICKNTLIINTGYNGEETKTTIRSLQEVKKLLGGVSDE